MNNPILLIGAGKMGGALLEGWLRQGIPAKSIMVVEADAAQAEMLASTYGVQVAQSVRDVPLSPFPAGVVLAVKPQQMTAVLEDCKPLASGGALFISIAAGKTTAYFTRHLGEHTPVIRAMPNLPAIIGQGATVLYATASVTEAQTELAKTLFEAAGHYDFIDDERLMDAVTALSGSGPAYIFLMAEAMIDAGKTLGLSETMAASLAGHTLLGSAALLTRSEKPAARLRQDVTSPNGTTEAALTILMKDDTLKKLMADAMQAACKRSEELAE